MNILVVVITIALVVMFTLKFKRKKALALANAEQGNAYLAKNKSREEVNETESGLQFEILHRSDSEQRPTEADKVTVHYHGTLIDGSVFDSSVDRGQPIDFFLTQVIAGWTEGLQLMAKGDKFRLYIPSHIAYGSRQVGTIPGGSVLIFDVELLAINNA